MWMVARRLAFRRHLKRLMWTSCAHFIYIYDGQCHVKRIYIFKWNKPTKSCARNVADGINAFVKSVQTKTKTMHTSERKLIRRSFKKLKTIKHGKVNMFPIHLKSILNNFDKCKELYIIRDNGNNGIFLLSILHIFAFLIDMLQVPFLDGFALACESGWANWFHRTHKSIKWLIIGMKKTERKEQRKKKQRPPK